MDRISACDSLNVIKMSFFFKQFIIGVENAFDATMLVEKDHNRTG